VLYSHNKLQLMLIKIKIFYGISGKKMGQKHGILEKSRDSRHLMWFSCFRDFLLSLTLRLYDCSLLLSAMSSMSSQAPMSNVRLTLSFHAVKYTNYSYTSIAGDRKKNSPSVATNFPSRFRVVKNSLGLRNVSCNSFII